MFKKYAAILALGAVLSTLSPVLVLAQSSDEATAKMEMLKEELKKNPNFLQYTEYMMLKSKYGQPKTNTNQSYYYDDDYYLKPYGSSALSKEFAGGFNGDDSYILGDSISIITGARAVNESLQVGSIGSDATGRVSANQRQIQSALELYFNDKNTYPNTLQELVPNYIGLVPEGFSYQKVGSSYALTFGDMSQQTINISDIAPLEIKSHPWDSMIKNKAEIPGMFSLLPADNLTIYFKDLNKLNELEETVKSISKPFGDIYGLNGAGDVKAKIFSRLGIKDNKEIRSLISEAALSAYDLDAYPNTDYALVIKVKSSLLNSFVSEYVTAPKDRHGQVGDYYVIATDSSLFSQIKNTNKDDSLASKKDLAYTFSVLEKDYDGFAYISEDFVKKLTSPSYRINARRRNTVLKALETLQYTSFAYRGITGSWASNFEQIISEGYIKGGSVANLSDYSIDGQGVVKHKTWGSIYDVTPIARVSIDSVFQSEKNLYESFKEGYQNYWREYIDPVGVSILVGDQIRFHTIILPLIDKSEYNWIKSISGGSSVVFDFLKNPDRLPSIQGVMKLSMDDLLYTIYKESGYIDEEYSKCSQEYYNKYYYGADRVSNPPTIKEVCEAKLKPRDEAVKYMKDKVAKEIDWNENTPVFDFFGDEITLAAGDKLSFKDNDFTKLDIYFGIELKDTAMTKKFIDKVFEWYGKESSGGSAGYGFIRLENNKPIKNNYNGTDFYIVPLGYTNFYYAFVKNRLYMTISQSALNNLIDGSKDKSLKWPDYMQRLFEYTGNEMNTGLFVDNEKLQPWLKGIIKDQWEQGSGGSELRIIYSYYAESLALAKNLSNYNGTDSNVSSYYRFIPKTWYDSSLFAKNGEVYLRVSGKEYNMNDIDMGNYSYYYYDKQDTSKKTVKLKDITSNFNVDAAWEKWKEIKDLGIAFNFTEEGLDIKVVFTNTASNKFDSRVGGLGSNKEKIFYFILGGGGIIVLIGVGLYFFKRKKVSVMSVSEPAVMPAAQTVSEQQTPPVQAPAAEQPAPPVEKRPNWDEIERYK